MKTGIFDIYWFTANKKGSHDANTVNGQISNLSFYGIPAVCFIPVNMVFQTRLKNDL
jgi:hypothetical protein